VGSTALADAAGHGPISGARLDQRLSEAADQGDFGFAQQAVSRQLLRSGSLVGCMDQVAAEGATRAGDFGSHTLIALDLGHGRQPAFVVVGLRNVGETDL
jgi:hypothetical protein